MDILNVDILTTSDLSIGKMASIQFPQGKFPTAGMIVAFKGERYKIKSTVLFADPFNSLANQNRIKGIYECLIELVD